jgi:rRNA maturation endonuclease Nob1
MTDSTSTLGRLKEELRGIEEQLAELVAISPVKWRTESYFGHIQIVGGPDYYFAEPTSDQLRLQLPLKASFERWFERFSLLYKRPPADLSENIEKAQGNLASWIELGGSNYDLRRDPALNASAARAACEPFYKFLDLLEGGSEIVVIPDTNALIAAPDPLKYTSIAGTKEFTFLLLPTVLAELDNLKNFARDPTFRTKVGKVVRRIKGWRRQGSLHSGVTLHSTVSVRAIAQEPHVNATLSWLDPSNRDDRILASALEVEVQMPSAHVILVTGDINLQNKCEAAKLPHEEIP